MIALNPFLATSPSRLLFLYFCIALFVFPKGHNFWLACDDIGGTHRSQWAPDIENIHITLVHEKKPQKALWSYLLRRSPFFSMSMSTLSRKHLHRSPTS